MYRAENLPFIAQLAEKFNINFLCRDMCVIIVIVFLSPLLIRVTIAVE